MSSPPKIKFYLIHTETGQRYPISEQEVVIGRSSGDLLFPEDTKLSTQHCRIAMTPSGLGVHDLGSANGTRLEGKKLDADKIYAFKIGNILSVGQQQFKLQEVSIAKRITPRRRTSSAHSKDNAARSNFLLAVAALLGGLTLLSMSYGHKPAPTGASIAVESPYDKADKEVRAIFDAYAKLGRDQQDGKVNDQELAAIIDKKLLPAIQQVQLKLSVITGSSEYERRKQALTRKLVAALNAQLRAMSEFAQTKSKKSEHDLKKYSQELEVLNQKAKVFRTPTFTD